MIERIPPHSDEAEISVLGAAFLDLAAADDAIEALTEEDFYHPAHRVIFRAIRRLREGGHAPDVRAVQEELSRTAMLQEAGGEEYLARVYEIVPTAVNIPFHVERVLDNSGKRRLITAATKILGDAYEPGRTAHEVSDLAQREVFAASGRSNGTGDHRLRDLLVNALRPDIASARSLPTPWADLNRLIGGLRPGDYCVLAGRPSHGKSALAIQTAYSLRDHGGILYASLEMPADAIAKRFLACSARTPLVKLIHGADRSRDEDEALSAAKRVLEQSAISITTGARTIGQLASKARKLAREDLRLVIVDYLQLMTGDTRENRETEVASISRGLKALALDLDIPVLALSQLNREAEIGPRPRLSHLRESGSLENDADDVILVRRPDFGMTAREAEQEGVAGLAELFVAKNRNGPTGVVELYFDGPSVTFSLRETRRTTRGHSYQPI